MTRLLCYDEFGKGMGFPSMKDSFQSEKYEGQETIAEYLKNAGDTTMVSMTTKPDFITGEPIKMETQFRDDGVFDWLNVFAYYVEKYNLRLPKDFEDHVLRKV